MRKILKGVLFSLIPAICAYLSQSDTILDWLQNNGYLGNKIDLGLFRNCMCILSIFFTFVVLTVPMIVNEIQRDTYKTQRDMLLRNNKEIFETTLKSELGLSHCKLNIRVFVPKAKWLHDILKCIGIRCKLEYKIKNIYGLAEKDITDKLEFEVEPNKQGLVGDCYAAKAVLYDDDLENSNERNYNLTKYQIAKTNKLKFILVCPIFSALGEIVAIVSIDSNDEIKVDKAAEDKLRNMVLNYTQTLYECIPNLFI